MMENGFDKDTLDLLNSSTKTPFDYVVKKFNAKKKKSLVKYFSRLKKIHKKVKLLLLL